MERLTYLNGLGKPAFLLNGTEVTGKTADCLAAYEDEAEKRNDSMTSSHSEAAILRGCIALMQELMGRFEEYLEFLGIHPDSDEERFCTDFYMTAIVERLFLWETHHSGGTSQCMKLDALGVETETVTFRDNRDMEDY